MIYTLKRNFLSLKEIFFIQDSTGKTVLRINKNFFDLKRTMTIYNEQGLPVGMIKKNIFSIFPSYNIYIDGELKLRITRLFKLFRLKIHIKSIDENYHMEGSFIRKKFKIYKDNNIIANISGEYNLNGLYNIETEESSFLESISIVIVLHILGRRLLLNT